MWGNSLAHALSAVSPQAWAARMRAAGQLYSCGGHRAPHQPANPSPVVHLRAPTAVTTAHPANPSPVVHLQGQRLTRQRLCIRLTAVPPFPLLLLLRRAQRRARLHAQDAAVGL